MRIVDIRAGTVSTAEERSNATMDFREMTTGIVAVVTDVRRNGRPVVGYGFGGTGRYSQEAIVRGRLAPRVLAAAPDALVDAAGVNIDPHKVWDAMMQREKPGGHGDRAVAAASLDMAVWDAAAKIAGMPLYAFLAQRTGVKGAGKTDRPPRVPVYVGGGYYAPGRTLAQLQDEMRGHLADGFVQLKMKIGGASLDEDMRRLDAVLEVVPPENLSVDANGRFDLDTALAYGRRLAPYGLRWYEDPGDPLDFDIQAAVAAEYPGPLATGENLMSRQDAQNLIRYGGMRADRDLLLFDCALAYGIVEYLRILDMLAAAGWTRRACWPHGGHLLSLHLAAGLGLGGTECYPRTHQPFGGFTDDTVVEDGVAVLPDLPGLGFEGKATLIETFETLTPDLSSRPVAVGL